ncbi:MAG: hypothetical protein ACXVOI_04945 [Tumebacillaceae bacterium]
MKKKAMGIVLGVVMAFVTTATVTILSHNTNVATIVPPLYKSDIATIVPPLYKNDVATIFPPLDGNTTQQPTA